MALAFCASLFAVCAFGAAASALGEAAPGFTEADSGFAKALLPLRDGLVGDLLLGKKGSLAVVVAALLAAAPGGSLNLATSGYGIRGFDASSEGLMGEGTADVVPLPDEGRGGASETFLLSAGPLTEGVSEPS